MPKTNTAAARGGVDPNAPGIKLAVRVAPEIVQGGTELAICYLQRGVCAFPDYARQVIEDVGDRFDLFSGCGTRLHATVPAWIHRT
jgi:hypothetical protein